MVLRTGSGTPQSQINRKPRRKNPPSFRIREIRNPRSPCPWSRRKSRWRFVCWSAVLAGNPRWRSEHARYRETTTEPAMADTVPQNNFRSNSMLNTAEENRTLCDNFWISVKNTGKLLKKVESKQTGKSDCSDNRIESEDREVGCLAAKSLWKNLPQGTNQLSCVHNVRTKKVTVGN